MESDEVIKIDGSILEGGGQILRISLSLASLFLKKTKISKIRGKRNPPGLKNQHAAISQALANITNSKIIGANVKSEELIFIPNNSQNSSDVISTTRDSFECDCQSAGSIGLMIQQTLPCLIFMNREISLSMKGGTIVSHSPSTYYVNDVLLPILKKMNIDFSLNVQRHGLFPVGMGRANLKVNPVKEILPISVDNRGELKSVLIRIAYTPNLKLININEIGKFLKKEIKKEISKNNENDDEDIIIIDIDLIQLSERKSVTVFGQVILNFENTIVSAENLFSEKKEKETLKNFEEKLIEEFNKIYKNKKICFDEYTVDHLIIFAALANGISKLSTSKVSLHTLTAIEVIQKFAPSISFEVTNEGDETSHITINGINFKNN